MKRSRVLVVTLVIGVCFFGGAIPTHAGPRFPDTLDKTLELARGLRISATSRAGVFVQRSARSLPIRGNLIAISLRTLPGAADGVEEQAGIEARFHTAKGWGAWEALGVETAEGPDTSSAEYAHASRRVYTLPIWVGTADRMAFRVTAHAGAPAMWDFRAHVINSQGDAHKPNIVQRVVSAVSRFLRGSSAEAMTGTPSIITRHQWGANESWRDSAPRYAPSLQMAFIHHTAGSNSYSRSQVPGIIRSIYKYHTSNLGYADIAYNFLVDRYGRIYEGRYGGITKPVIGAHAGGFNTGSTGLSLIGTFSSSTPPAAMIRSLKRLLAWKLDVHHVPPTGTVVMTSAGSTRYPAGRRVSLNRISGHRDTSKTACPGAKVYYQLSSIRSSVKKLGNPKIYLPTLSATLVRPNGDTKNETVTLKASFSQAISWKVDFRNRAGSLLKTFSGSGTTMAPAWNGIASGATRAATGVVNYTISGIVGSLVARPATGSLYVVGDHPDGTVLSSPTRTVLLEGGKARPIPTTLVRNSWFRSTEPVAATEADIDRYPTGQPLEIREGTLLVESDGNYSVFTEGKRRRFDTGVFTALGYAASAALPISDEERDALQSGPDWSDVTRHPAGALVKAPDGSKWLIGSSARNKAKSDIVWKSWYRDNELVSAAAGDITLPIGSDATYRNGTRLRISDGTYAIVAAGQKRRFYDVGLYGAMGYSTAPMFAMSSSEAGAIPTGPVIG